MNVWNDVFTQLGYIYQQGIIRAGVKTHFSEKFIPSDNTYNESGDKIMVSTQLSSKPIARDTARGDYGRGNDLGSFTDINFTLPNFNMNTKISASELEKRHVGQNPFIPVSKSEQYARVLLKKSKQDIDSIHRAFEKMSIDALINGKVVFENNKPLDFGVYPSHKMTPASLWDNASSDPIADLDAIHQVLMYDGGDQEYITYMGQKALTAFLYNSKVQNYIQKFSKGFVSSIVEIPNTSNDGVGYYEAIPLPSGLRLNIRTYNEFYDTFDEKGNRTSSTRMFPDNCVLIMGQNTPLVRGLGVPEILPEELRVSNTVSQVLSINGGSIMQFVSFDDVKSLSLLTLSCQAPIIPSMDRIATIAAVA